VVKNLLKKSAEISVISEISGKVLILIRDHPR